MSLATRCSACNTVFRVVQDQLKVSEGWVRCGRCNAVFNALEGLFDLEPAPAPAPMEVAPMPQEAAPPAFAVAQEPVSAMPAADEPEPAAAASGFDETPASRVAAQDRIDFADARFNSALLAEAGIAAETEPPAEPQAAEPAGVAEPPPEFLRKAERQAQWARPRTVAGLAVLGLLLTCTLALQAALHQRDLVATLLPQTRPALQALCDAAGCRIEPLRRIDDIMIESSSLTSASAGDAVQLVVVLRNRGVFTLAMPSIELTLTDAGGQMLVRRALSPADFGVADATLPAASEAPLQLQLTTGSRRASGYTVEPFYP